MSGGEEREPAGDVLFAEREGFSREEDEGIEDGAPRDVLVVERIVEMACADGVFGKYQGASVWVPDRESPVANQHGEAIAAPVFVSAGDDGSVCGAHSDDVSHLADELGAVVQAAVPGEDGAGCGDVRLRFATGFVGGVEGVVEDADVALRIGASIIWAIGSDGGLRLFEIVSVHRLAIEIPPSKLNAHGRPSLQANCFSTDREQRTFPACM